MITAPAWSAIRNVAPVLTSVSDAVAQAWVSSTEASAEATGVPGAEGSGDAAGRVVVAGLARTVAGASVETPAGEAAGAVAHAATTNAMAATRARGAGQPLVLSSRGLRSNGRVTNRLAIHHDAGMTCRRTVGSGSQAGPVVLGVPGSRGPAPRWGARGPDRDARIDQGRRIDRTADCERWRPAFMRETTACVVVLEEAATNALLRP